jgi:succinate dehydrogenase/fumarate reductase cytochrome b subunit
VTRFSDASRHREAEELARAIWWGQADKGGLLGAPALVQQSAVLRRLLAVGFTRAALLSLLVGMRHAYYDLRIERALSRSRIAAWLRDALCLTAVVSVAPQLSD